MEHPTREYKKVSNFLTKNIKQTGKPRKGKTQMKEEEEEEEAISKFSDEDESQKGKGRRQMIRNGNKAQKQKPERETQLTKLLESYHFCLLKPLSKQKTKEQFPTIEMKI